VVSGDLQRWLRDLGPLIWQQTQHKVQNGHRSVYHGPTPLRVKLTDGMSELTDSTLTARPSIQGALVLMTWRNPADCLDERPELFFPTGNASSVVLQIEKAKAVCRRCAVDAACVKWAIESGQDAGVWDGLSEDERHALKRRNARTRRAT
jgi:WhiB family transcriptional regulator, redox-sensing transcriptional regulator